MKLRILTLAAVSLSFALGGCDSEPALTDQEPADVASAPQLGSREALGKLAQQTATLEAGQPIPGHYIVVFKSSVADPPGLAKQITAQFGSEPTFTYQYAIKGFAAALPDQAVTALSHNPNVEWIEEDGVVEISSTQSNPPSWGLDRVDQHNLPLNAAYNYDYNGSGVHAYIIDTGIRYTHTDFGGRASFDADFGTDGGGLTNNGDCHGHGTHVSGTIGSSTYGLAKNVRLHGVRVLNCNGSGSYSAVIAGIDWVRNNAIHPAVANMSLGGGFSSSLNAAVANLVSSGVTLAVAAGNSNANACNYSPSSAPSALTIGSTTSSDSRSSFSNYGTCVDLFAPGSSITSTYKSSDTSTATMSGTSMASPHVAGAAVLILDEHPSWTPSQVEAEIKARATSGVVGSVGTGSPNLLLYTLGSGGGTPVTNKPPTADFTFTTTNLKADFTDASTDSDGSVDGWSWTFGDGGTSSAQNPSHTYGAAGTYTVELVATDNGGDSDSTSKSVTVTEPPADTPVHSGGIIIDVTFNRKNANATAAVIVHDDGEATVANATVTGDWLVNDSPKKTDVSSVSQGDGVATISSGGMKGVKSSNKITFCVTDISGSGLVYDATSNHPTCADYDSGGGGGGDPPPSSGFTLSTKANKGQKTVALSWSGSSATSFDVYRDGSVITTVGSTNQYTDSPGKGTFEYQVCEAGTSTCSNKDSAKI